MVIWSGTLFDELISVADKREAEVRLELLVSNWEAELEIESATVRALA